MYSKNRSQYHYEQTYVSSTYDPGYSKFITNRNEPFNLWNVVGLNDHVATDMGYQNTREARLKLGRVGFDATVAQFALEHADSVFQATAISNAAGRNIVEVRDTSAKTLNQVFYIPREGYEDIYVLNGRQVYFYSWRFQSLGATPKQEELRLLQ